MLESNFDNQTTESAPAGPVTSFDNYNETVGLSINSTAWPAFTSSTDESSTIFASEESSVAPAGTAANREIDLWHKIFIGSIANAIRLVRLLVDNSDKLLVYLIVSVTGCLIVLLLGLTIKMIVNKNSTRHVKRRRRSASDASPQCHGRSRAGSSRQFVEAQSQRRQHESSSNRKHSGHRSHYAHNGHKLSKLAGESGPTHYSSRISNSRGFDRVRNQEYTPVSTSENPSRMSTMQLQSHTNDGRAPRNSSSACGTSNFLQNISESTRPILQGEMIPSQSFHVVRFKPQLLASKISNTPVPTSYAGDFDDFDD